MYLGAKTIRTLYQEHDIDSLDALEAALNGRRLNHIKGLGAKTLEAIRQTLEARPDTHTPRQKRLRAAPQPTGSNLAFVF